MSIRTWVSVVTVLLLGIIIYFSRQEIAHAWQLLGQVNVWILLLLIPGQLLVYYAAGEMVFSYLRAKDSISEVKPFALARMALEMNFVNHVLPSAGVSGASYMNWRLHQYGVPAGRATMAQVVRYAMAFMAFIVLLLVALIVITIDGNINRWIILFSALLIVLMGVSIVGGIYLLGSQTRIRRFSMWSHRTINRIMYVLTLGRKKRVVKEKAIEEFFDDMHRDYLALKHDKRILRKPFWWGILFTLADVALFVVTFWALGTVVNPAIILVAYGLAGIAAIVAITPGGAGVYEAVMVSFLALAGVASGTAIAGILLTRVILLIGTILLGYVFYQHALMTHGKK